MPKLAIAQVIWNAQDAIYQVQEKGAPQTSIPVMDFTSAAWQEWLGRVPSFAFQSKEGYRFTARKLLCRHAVSVCSRSSYKTRKGRELKNNMA